MSRTTWILVVLLLLAVAALIFDLSYMYRHFDYFIDYFIGHLPIIMPL